MAGTGARAIGSREARRRAALRIRRGAACRDAEGAPLIDDVLHRELKLSKGAAQNRKTAAELIQAFPEIEAGLRHGELCLSTVNEVAKVLTPENRREVLPRFFGFSRREAEEVVVSLRPAEVVPTREVVTAVRPAVPAPRTVAAQAALPAAAAVPIERAVHLDEPASAVQMAEPAGVRFTCRGPPRHARHACLGSQGVPGRVDCARLRAHLRLER